MRVTEQRSRRFQIVGQCINPDGEWAEWEDIHLHDASLLATRLERFSRRADRRDLRVRTYIYLFVEGEQVGESVLWEQVGQSDETIIVRPPATIRVEAPKEE